MIHIQSVSSCICCIMLDIWELNRKREKSSHIKFNKWHNFLWSGVRNLGSGVGSSSWVDEYMCLCQCRCRWESMRQCTRATYEIVYYKIYKPGKTKWDVVSILFSALSICPSPVTHLMLPDSTKSTHLFKSPNSISMTVYSSGHSHKS